MKKLRIPWETAAHLWRKATDREIAKFLGCSHSAVTNHRSVQNIPAYHNAPHLVKLQWETAAHLWGKATDREIALFLGGTCQQVLYYRQKNDIDAFYKKAFNLKIPEDLGVTPDIEIADREHVTLAQVQRWRQNRGVPSPYLNAPHVEEARRKAREDTRNRLKTKKGVMGPDPASKINAQVSTTFYLPRAMFEEIHALLDDLEAGHARVRLSNVIREIVEAGLPIVKKRAAAQRRLLNPRPTRPTRQRLRR